MKNIDLKSLNEDAPKDISILKLLWRYKKAIFLLLPFLLLQGQNSEQKYQDSFNKIIATARLEMEKSGIPMAQSEAHGFLSDFIYKNVAPAGGDGFTSIMEKIQTDSPEKRQFYKGISPGKEALWKLYLGIPLDEIELELVRISEYRPGNSEEQRFYYTLPRYDDAVFRFFKKNFWKWKQGKYDDFLGEYVFDPKTLLEEINDDYERKSTEKRFNVASFALGGFKIELGEDEQGKYLSYYDLWDLEAMGISVTPFFGRPLEIYNRIYYQEIIGEVHGEIDKKTVVGVIRMEK